MMAQAAHAASAVQHRYADHVDMKRYLSGEDGRGWEVMRKAVLEVRMLAASLALVLMTGARRGGVAESCGKARGRRYSSSRVDGGAVSARAILCPVDGPV